MDLHLFLVFDGFIIILKRPPFQVKKNRTIVRFIIDFMGGSGYF